MFISIHLSTKDYIAYIWLLLYWGMGHAQLFYSYLDGYEMGHTFWDYVISYIYLCEIKIKDDVIFLYESSRYNRYDYIMSMYTSW